MEWEGGLPAFLAVMLDSGNPAVKEAFRTAVYENQGSVSTGLIQALFFSRQESGWKMAADLLLAAKLQEGLRYTVLQCCSQGRMEAFRYMMRVIAENDLLRYTSTVQTVCGWLCFPPETFPTGAIRRMFASALAALEDPEHFHIETPQDLFLSLWAQANTEAAEAKQRIEKMLTEGRTETPRLCAALIFYKTTGAQLPVEIVLESMKRYRKDPILFSCILNSYTVSEPSGMTPETAFRLYFEFKDFLPDFPKKTQKFTHPVFVWITLYFSPGILWHNILLPLALTAWDETVLNDAAENMQGMPVEERSMMLYGILEYLAPERLPETYYPTPKKEDKELRQTMPHTPELRNALFCSLEDKSTSNREKALSIISRLKLTGDELLLIENLLALKNSSIRCAALKILKNSGEPQACAARLRASGNPQKIAAAEELVPQEMEKIPVFDREHGYGLYDVHEKWEPELPQADMAYHPKNILRGNSAAAKQILEDLQNIIQEHGQDECRSNMSDSILGNVIKFCYADNSWSSDMMLNIPCPELWDGYFAGHPCRVRDLVHAFLLLLSPAVPEVREGYFGLSEQAGRYRDPGFLRAVIHRQLRTMPDFPEFAEKFCIASLAGVPETFWKQKIPLPPVNLGYKEFIANEDTIRSVFALFNSALLTPESLAARYRFCRLHRHDSTQYLSRAVLSIPILAEAYRKEYISRNTFRRLLLTMEESSFGLDFLTLSNHEDVHPEIRILIEDAVKLELRRGEEQTKLSRGLGNIVHLRGAFFFAELLNALGDAALIRGYTGGSRDKAATFSHLLKICTPLPEDNEESFRKALKPFRIPEKRLLEAAMYSPVWLDLAGAYLKIPALPMSGWYFHAHLHEQYSFNSQKKEAYISRYSPVALQEFSDGAFDIDWFREAYQAVGPVMFHKLYQAAKYISGGANHRRSQIFADAALGKLKEKEVEQYITEKRNKEYVMAYGILPGKDFLHRYEVLMQFRKESRQFGGQRQASEKLAVEIALGNLARTAGFPDVNRFLWRMEAAQLESLKKLFIPRKTGDVMLSLAIDDSGYAALKTEKDGKILKSLPAALKKQETVLELQEAIKKLRDQHVRAKKTLEDAMIRGDVFAYSEVSDLMSNPVLGPLASKLLWCSGGQIGFFHELPEAPLVIAHPVDLLKSGHWLEFQNRIVEMKQSQPFKQIFRELYTLNADEKKDGINSRRYSGHQIMPKQALALLRTRGWTINADTGIQKVFHKQNLIAEVDIAADWFAIAESEPLTLESVFFENRQKGGLEPLKTIPPVLFSEVMRDLDLMVSVAHAGGVDPEASHSTVEMRAALVSALLPLFKLKNVRIEKSHAFITGKFGEYNVHLGSGVCHKQASGMLNILPVHSQTRGRLFLPFADDDPKTSEVVTKILFLAEDDKIKDPSILEQIKGGNR